MAPHAGGSPERLERLLFASLCVLLRGEAAQIPLRMAMDSAPKRFCQPRAEVPQRPEGDWPEVIPAEMRVILTLRVERVGGASGPLQNFR